MLSTSRLRTSTVSLLWRLSQRRDIRQASQVTGKWTFQELDARWQNRWAQQYQNNSHDIQHHDAPPKPKYYVLPMFAYPSGSLHMGHLRVYTISDIIARYRRMNGFEVLHPTGWDAFGLPAENAAIERGIDPAVWTEDNIAKMKKQLISMNTSFNWDSEFSTCSPSFYKHTQKIFLMLFNRGLAYQAEALVNFDPVDRTVLANEQVDSNGRSWRSGATVQQIMLKQWFFRITAFRDALLNDLKFLAKGNKWPERVLAQQRNWMGRSQGAKIQFRIASDAVQTQTINVFTTRPDTLFGVTYLALSMSHPIVERLSKNSLQLRDFLSKKSSFAPDSKEGFCLTSIAAINPLSHLSNQCSNHIPVFVAPYVLDEYGEGAVMGVPAHDARDLAFWKQQRPSEKVPVVIATTSETNPEELQPVSTNLSEVFTCSGVLTQLCGNYAGLSTDEAGERIIGDLNRHGLAETTEIWRLRDWLVSRQRYWGTPIPIVHCKQCGAMPVPEDQLPIELPKLDDTFRGKTGNPLDKIESWVNTTCPGCNGPAKRETDTMDTFVDSSWYFMRFPDAHNASEPFSLVSANTMLPIDAYVGGVEHAILHLLYARFIYKFLTSEGLVDPNPAAQEPFQQLVTQGMVHGKTFSDPATGRFLLPHEVLDAESVSPIMIATGKSPAITWEKMSKSKHNGVDPSICIKKFGADATRAHIVFAAPISEVLQWDEEKIVGIQRWFHRITRLVDQFHDMNLESHPEAINYLSPENTENLVANLTTTDTEAFLLTQNTIKAVTQTFEREIYGLNTTISDLTKLTNGLTSIGLPRLVPWVAYECLTSLLLMLGPIAPAFAEQSWEDLHQLVANPKHNKGIFECEWPKYILDADLERQFRERMKTMTCAVQINGKLRFTAEVPILKAVSQHKNEPNMVESALTDSILATEEGKYWLLQKNDWEKRKRVVIVAGGKLVNIVF